MKRQPDVSRPNPASYAKAAGGASLLAAPYAERACELFKEH